MRPFRDIRALFRPLNQVESETSIVEAEESGEIEEFAAPVRKPKKINNNVLHPHIHWTPTTPITYLELLTTEDHCQAIAKDYKSRVISGDYIFNPPAGTLLNAGDHELSLTFIPHKSHKYFSATVTRSIVVNKRRPVVEWNCPISEIVFGQRLDLNIFTFVNCELKEGSFYFSHEAGIILEIGVHTLMVEYEPSKEEKANWTRGYAKVQIKVIGCLVPLSWRLSMDAEPITYPQKIPSQWFCARSLPVIDVFTEADNSFENAVEGTFTYSHNCEEIYTAGIQTLIATFTPANGHKYRVSTIALDITILQATPTLEWGRPVAIAEGEPLEKSILNASNTQKLDGVYEYTPPYGTVLPLGEHKLYVTFYPQDPSWCAVSAFVVLRVLNKRVPVLYWPKPSALVYPAGLTRAQLCCSVSGGYIKGVMIYDPPMGTILHAGTHKLTATFQPARPGIAVVSATVEVIIYPTVSRLLWPTPDSILEGEGIFDNILNCRCSNNEGGVFTYTPPRGTPLPPGEHKLTVHYVPEDMVNFMEATAHVMLLVREHPKITPKLHWLDVLLNPNDGSSEFPYGTMLNEAMLNASCTNAKGDFGYDPPLGAKLDVGVHTVVASFTPYEVHKFIPLKICATINIIKTTPRIVWEPEVKKLFYGDPLCRLQLNAFVKGELIPGKFVYKPPIESILDSGDHTLHVTFVPDESHNYYSVEATADICVRRGFPKIEWLGNVDVITYPTRLSILDHLNPRCLTPNLPGKFGFSHTPGTILPVGKHTLTCRYYVEDIVNYLSAGASIDVTVVKGTPNIIWLPDLVMPYETPLNNRHHCNAKTELEGGVFVYDPPAGTVIDAGENFKFVMTYTPKDSDNYADVKIYRYLKITKCVPMLSWDVLHSVIKYGKPLDHEELCARLSPDNTEQTLTLMATGTFVYDPPAGSILPAADAQFLTVTFLPPPEHSHNYEKISKTIPIVVSKAKPELRWKPKTLNILEGEPITDKQLNAYILRPDVFPGRLSYNPPEGTILPPGRHPVEVEFWPDQPENALRYTGLIKVEVVKKPPQLVWVFDPMTGQMKCKKQEVRIK